MPKLGLASYSEVDICSHSFSLKNLKSLEAPAKFFQMWNSCATWNCIFCWSSWSWTENWRGNIKVQVNSQYRFGCRPSSVGPKPQGQNFPKKEGAEFGFQLPSCLMLMQEDWTGCHIQIQLSLCLLKFCSVISCSYLTWRSISISPLVRILGTWSRSFFSVILLLSAAMISPIHSSILLLASFQWVLLGF